MTLAVPYTELKLYHATSTGTNNEILDSFLKEGIKPSIAKGSGQGQGFYVWTTLQRARQHAGWLLSEGLIKDSGHPLMIVLSAQLNPVEWDMDYEFNVDIVLAFLIGHFDLFKKIPDNAVETKLGKLITSECTKGSLGEHYIQFMFLKDKGRANYKIILKDDPFERGIMDGEILGKVFNYLQEKFPKDTRSYEEQVFIKIATSKSIALKYVGKTPLRASQYMVHDGTKWLEGEEAILYAENNKG